MQWDHSIAGELLQFTIMSATHGCRLTQWLPLGAACTFILNALHIAYPCYMSYQAHTNLNLVGEGVSLGLCLGFVLWGRV